MFRHQWLVLIVLAGCGRTPPAEVVAYPVSASTETSPGLDCRVCTHEMLTATGETIPTPGRVSEIAATVMHPVTRVLVSPGDFVRVGQPLIELDADEPEAEVRAKQAQVSELTAALSKLRSMPRAEERAEAKANHESDEIACKAEREHYERLKTLRESDAISARQLIEQHTALLRTEADERASHARLEYLMKLPIEQELSEAASKLTVAQAELDACKAELEHYVVCASIDGMICWLDVTPGTVSRAGTKTWGEIVDLREVDVRVELSPGELSCIDVTHPATVREVETKKSWTAKVVHVWPSANRASGRVPVILRVAGTKDQPLRCHLKVVVDFAISSGSESTDPPTLETFAAEALAD